MVTLTCKQVDAPAVRSKLVQKELNETASVVTLYGRGPMNQLSVGIFQMCWCAYTQRCILVPLGRTCARPGSERTKTYYRNWFMWVGRKRAWWRPWGMDGSTYKGCSLYAQVVYVNPLKLVSLVRKTTLELVASTVSRGDQISRRQLGPLTQEVRVQTGEEEKS